MCQFILNMLLKKYWRLKKTSNHRMLAKIIGSTGVTGKLEPIPDVLSIMKSLTDFWQIHTMLLLYVGTLLKNHLKAQHSA